MNKYEREIVKLTKRWLEEVPEDQKDQWTMGYYSGQLSMIELLALQDPDVQVEDYQRILSATYESDCVIKKGGLKNEEIRV